MLFVGREKAVADVGYDVPGLDLFEVSRDFHSESRSMFAHSHELLYLLQIVLRPVVLVLFQHLDVGAAVPLPNMLDEI